MATVRIGVCVFTVLGASILSGGCSRGTSGPDAAALVGSWIEVVDADVGASPRVPIPETKPNKIRRISFEQSGRFKLEVCKLDGTPLGADKTIEGAWRREKGYFVFEATGTVDPDLADWSPERTGGVREVSTKSGPVRRLKISDEGGRTVLYKPAE